MLFSSVTFIYIFIPAILIAYFITPKKFRNHILLVFSLLFYFSGEPKYSILLILSSVSDYLHSLYIEKHRDTKNAKVALVSSIIINLLMLGIFKYSDFVIITINEIFGLSIPLTNLPLPIGISFFTFQTMSYTIDVYRGDVHAEKNIFSFSTFVCLFPQLIAGPIVRYSDIANELHDRKITIKDFSDGISRFVIGLSKKVLIANVLGELCIIFRENNEKSVLFYWMYAFAFSFQIYFDFSGYSDMAIGLGHMFGFSFPENFNYPYISTSITDFWRRWHMTLSGWFRDYVYIPLGGNRVSKSRWLFNILIVWFLTGLWHGASWNFVIWGVMYGVLLVFEKLFMGKFLKKSGSFAGHIYVSLITLIGFVIFNAGTTSEIFTDLGGMFGFLQIPFLNSITLYYLKSYLLIFAVAFLASTPIMKKLFERVSSKKIMLVLQPLTIGILLIIVTGYLVDGSFNPFLYFRF
ncbi:MAG: MBOAT family O-acyltransferase [Oscillospiraceae bacterium]